MVTGQDTAEEDSVPPWARRAPQLVEQFNTGYTGDELS